jgi:CrcB protein
MDGMENRLVGVGIVAVGGGAGAVARWGVGLAVAGATGTLVANVAGSFLLGVLVARTLPEWLQLFGAAGFCSSFTTYSTFAVETLSLGARFGGLYIVGTYALGIAAAGVGIAVGRRA